jgi:hydroxymethylglutaryl-CoA lyase
MSIRLVEVGPRDGLQNESKPLSVEMRTEFVERLIGAGVKNVEVGAFVSPKWVPQMAESGEVAKELATKQNSGEIPKPVRLMSLVPNNRGYEDARKAGVREAAVFTAASESFSKKNTNASIKESLARIEEIMPQAKKDKVRVRGYISMCWYCPFEGRIKESQVLDVAEKLADLGVYEVSIGDTVGAATPSEVRSLNKKLIRLLGAKKVAMHFHDTRGTALANVLASLEMGIETFDSSIGGLGGCPYAPGAAGNIATEDVVYMLHGMGVKTGYSLEKMRDVNAWISQKIGRNLKGAKPFRNNPLSRS